MKVVLASGSPRRADLLTGLGIEFEVVVTNVDETRLPNESAAVYVERVALAKAAAVETDDIVVAADTAVVHEGKVMGKPAHPAEAETMLRQLQGSEHEVFTGLAIRSPKETISAVDVTHVTMLPMTDVEIADYVNGGEPMDKAGAYALQGRGGVFVESIEGSPFTVIGLPIHLLPRLLSRVGYDLFGVTAT